MLRSLRNISLSQLEYLREEARSTRSIERRNRRKDSEFGLSDGVSLEVWRLFDPSFRPRGCATYRTSSVLRQQPVQDSLGTPTLTLRFYKRSPGSRAVFIDGGSVIRIITEHKYHPHKQLLSDGI